jgi:hypothetical protein
MNDYTPPAPVVKTQEATIVRAPIRDVTTEQPPASNTTPVTQETVRTPMEIMRTAWENARSTTTTGVKLEFTRDAHVHDFSELRKKKVLLSNNGWECRGVGCDDGCGRSKGVG